MFCPQCGGEFLQAPNGRCPHCGSAVEAQIPSEQAPGSPLGDGPQSGGSSGDPYGQGAGAGGGTLPPVPDPDTGRQVPPFEDPSSGFFDGIVDTLKGVYGAPGEFFRRMPDTTDIGRPVLYFLCLAFVGSFFKAGWGIIANTIFPPDPEQWRPILEQAGWPEPLIEWFLQLMGGGGLLAQAVVSIVLNPILALIGLLVMVSIIHVLLMLYGGANRDFGATFRVGAYGWGSFQLLQLIPLCGGLIAFVWGLAVFIIGLAETHRTSGFRATMAVLTPVLLCCLCCLGVMLLAAAGAGSIQP